jgi:hypothetical protein
VRESEIERAPVPEERPEATVVPLLEPIAS